MDLNLNGRLVLSDIGELTAEGRRLVVSRSSPTSRWCWTCWNMGVAGFVTKSEGQAHLLHAVRAAAADRPLLCPPTTAGVLVSDRSPVAPRLSQQERDVAPVVVPVHVQGVGGPPHGRVRAHRGHVHQAGPGQVRPGRSARTDEDRHAGPGDRGRPGHPRRARGLPQWTPPPE
ncbi:hypothetical protein LV779_27185 [Streptomyces thinghirensis]|nr:hypothetical protein [Streptomyces thinghirensis]